MINVCISREFIGMLKMGKRNQLNILNIPDCEFPSDEKSAVMQTFL